MSEESSEWLNTMVLIGFTEKRGHAWHYLQSSQGVRPNHYPRAIPVEDVLDRLFDWEPEIGTFETTTESGRHIVDPTRKTYVHPKTDRIFGTFKLGHQPHWYKEWLIRNVEQVMDDDGLQIASAGLLRGGGVAWVQYEFEENLSACGLEFRPFLTSSTSFDGSLASTYTRGNNATVCDNSLKVTNADTTFQMKVRHSSKSLGQLEPIREGLGLVIATGEDMIAEINRLNATKVSDRVWEKFLDDLVKVKPDAGVRAKNMAERKREELQHLYRSDERAAPWRGTALGVLMATNTHHQHMAHVRNMSRPERNALAVVSGNAAKEDDKVMALLRRHL